MHITYPISTLTLSMDPVIVHIRKDLRNSADPATQKTFQRFFKEEVQYYGVKVPTVRKIAQKYWKDIKVMGKKEIFPLGSSSRRPL